MEKRTTKPLQSISSVDLASLREQIAALAGSVEVLQAQLAEQANVIAGLTARLGGTGAQVHPGMRGPAIASAAGSEEADASPDLLLIIAAAVTAFLGKKVRIRSAKMLQSPYEIVNPWAQQGRVVVQASHYLRRG